MLVFVLLSMLSITSPREEITREELIRRNKNPKNIRVNEGNPGITVKNNKDIHYKLGI